jgi:uncharacterized protein YdeI (YjbR/CyaY-like superfamily)
MSDPRPVFFDSAARFRRWLEKNHAAADELWIGFWKASSGKRGLTYAEAVEESLCFGWIDGLKKRYDDDAFMHRFTPRRPKSAWSAINIRRAEALRAARRMAPAGLRAFERRDPARSNAHSFENRGAKLDAALEKRFRASRKAWSFFEAQPPGYRRLAAHWVMSAKRPETRLRRLAMLVADSTRGRRIGAVSGGK